MIDGPRAVTRTAAKKTTPHRLSESAAFRSATHRWQSTVHAESNGQRISRCGSLAVKAASGRKSLMPEYSTAALMAVQRVGPDARVSSDQRTLCEPHVALQREAAQSVARKSSTARRQRRYDRLNWLHWPSCRLAVPRSAASPYAVYL